MRKKNTHTHKSPSCSRPFLSWAAPLLIFIFGRLSHVHKLVVRGLQIAGISKIKAKQLTKYCSISAIISSRSVWRRRCFLYP